VNKENVNLTNRIILYSKLSTDSMIVLVNHETTTMNFQTLTGNLKAELGYNHQIYGHFKMCRLSIKNADACKRVLLKRHFAVLRISSSW